DLLGLVRRTLSPRQARAAVDPPFALAEREDEHARLRERATRRRTMRADRSLGLFARREVARLLLAQRIEPARVRALDRHREVVGRRIENDLAEAGDYE